MLYRNVLGRRDRVALALMSPTQLPLVLAITALATSDGHMRASTAAALVGGAVLSTLVFSVLGLRLRGDVTDEPLPRNDPEHPRDAAAAGEHPAAQGDIARDGGHG